jgi:hypothetical protein
MTRPRRQHAARPGPDLDPRCQASPELGLLISTDMPALIFDLMQLYPQTSQRRPSVESIPRPYGPPERRGGRRASSGGDR